jgi:hypothetical protein
MKIRESADTPLAARVDNDQQGGGCASGRQPRLAQRRRLTRQNA